ncbi:MAG: pyruvate ferredoxin oxidoreductase [Syntrophales bacterium]|nr:pyruvate ferredoxin oxidoreductase [Syntrophales bacterium]
MSRVEIMTGNQAAALGARLARVQVVAAYPITPQTSLTETLAQLIESGEMQAEYIRVDGEHSALTVCIAASTIGARAFTATSANGLLYMHEQIHWAAGSRLPIVMCCVNRGVGAPWTIFNDQQDSISQRDTGWIQLYCRDNQEIIDTVIQAFRIAETIYCPVMVCYDGFVLSHTLMPVEIPEEEKVDAFLPPYRPHTILDDTNPRTINPVMFADLRANAEGILCDGYMEIRYKLEYALKGALKTIQDVSDEYALVFGRDHGGLIWEYKTSDAEVILTGMGSIATEATIAADILREKGIPAGVVGIRAYRPFPTEALIRALKRARSIHCLEKAVSYGFAGPVYTDLRAALYGSECDAQMQDYITSLGGRDIQPSTIAEVVLNRIKSDAFDGRFREPIWINCRTE